MENFSFVSSIYDSVHVEIKNNEYYVDSSFYGRVPHIMTDGRICLHASNDLKILEYNESIFNEINHQYIRDLFELGREQKILEFLNELDYYLWVTNDQKYSNKYKITEKMIKLSPNTSIIRYDIETSDDFHNFLYLIFRNELEKISYDIYTNGVKIIEIRKDQKFIRYNYQFYEKNRLRVSRNLNKFHLKNFLFIGVGSVNSYIIKQVVAEYPNNIDLVDPSKFTQSNALRHAFYRENKFKTNSTQKTISSIINSCTVVSHEKKFKSTLKISYRLVDYVFVSVDNLTDWLDVYYQLKLCDFKPETIIVFVGIDGYARYGKYVYISYKDITDNKFYEFITHKSSQYLTRKMMVGAGCGNSTAIYTEYDLHKLAREVLINEAYTVKEVQFETID